MQDEAARDVVQAYQAVRIWVQTQNDKRMPPLDSFLPGEAGKRQGQTREEQHEALKLLSQMHGGRLIEVRRSA